MSIEPLTRSDLTIADAAAYKSVSAKTIRRWIAAGILPANRVGPKLIRIRAVDLDALGSPLRPSEG